LLYFDGEKREMRLHRVKRALAASVLILAFGTLSACSPEVGSEAWCQDMKDKPKGDWSSNEAADFAKHCVL
jgi:hypothetical protein